MVLQCANPGIPSIAFSNGMITVGGVTQAYPIGCGTTIIEPCDPNNPWTIDFDITITDPGDVLSVTALLPNAACNTITFTPALPLTGASPVLIHCTIAAICPPNPNCLQQLFEIRADDQCSPPNTGICRMLIDKPLPVELSSFLSTIKENDVTLNWITASEENNSRFEIERSNLINGNNSEWKTIGSVQGSGNSSTPKSYTLTDKNLNAGSYNYRLKQIDFNGNHQYHNLNGEVIIGVPTRFDLLQNYPNPFNPSTNIAYILPHDGNVKLNVYSSNGQLVSSINEGFKTAGYYTIEYNASDLASGVYYYRLDFGSGEKSFVKVMKMVVLK